MKMKYKKIIVNAAAACLLAGASGVALAVDCSKAFIPGTEVDEIKAKGQSCFIEGVVVTGDIIIANGEDVQIINTAVGGNVRVLGSRNAILVSNKVGGSIRVVNNELAILSVNIAQNIAVINNSNTQVIANAARRRIRCRENRRIDAESNIAPILRCRALGGNLFEPEPEL